MGPSIEQQYIFNLASSSAIPAIALTTPYQDPDFLHTFLTNIPYIDFTHGGNPSDKSGQVTYTLAIAK